MIVIADTSPIQYLVLIRQVDLLGRMYARVHVPQAVLAELSDDGAPDALREWASALPAWIAQTDPIVIRELHPKLGRGERAAISLCIERPHDAPFLIIDDARGRRLAEEHKVSCIGTIGVLQIAARRGLVDFQDALTQLQASNMRLPPEFR